MTLTEPQKREDYITWLKFFACLLITNSHCRVIYPLYFLAVGGGHGNAIFFAVSGFCLAVIKMSFAPWYRRRLWRLLPITATVLLIAVFFGDGLAFLGSLKLWEIVLYYINQYWFVPAILIYYIVFYFLFRDGRIRKAGAAFGIYAAGYLLLYLFCLDRSVFSIELAGFSWFKVYFYFGVMLSGGLLRLVGLRLSEQLQCHKKVFFVSAVMVILLSCILWAGTYGFVTVLGKGLDLQFLIHLSVWIFIVTLMLLCILFRERIRLPRGFGGKIVSLMAAATLEIYLIQITFKTFAESFSFPWNMLLFFGIAFGGGVLLYKMMTPLFNKVHFLITEKE